MASAASLKDYLRRYQSGDDDKRKKKKKKDKSKPASLGGGVLIVDEDPAWQKPVALEEPEDSDPAGEDDPVVDEDIEVKRMRRLEEIRARKPYLSISEDGSGWVSVSDVKGGSLRDSTRRGGRNDTPSPERDPGPPDLSPPRQRDRRRSHRPSPEGDGDDPPPRKGARGTSRRDCSGVDSSPPRRRSRNAEDVNLSRGGDNGGESPNADLSPPRRTRRGTPESEVSPRGRAPRGHAKTEPPESPNVADLSPPLCVRRRSTEDLSPVGGTRNSSPNEDLSPPRRARRSSPGSDPSHSRRDGKSFANSDLSPPRRARGNSRNAGASPPRPRCVRRRSTEDLSPVGGTRNSSPNEDLSPPRRARRSSPGSDPSPPRRDGKSFANSDLSPPRRARGNSRNAGASPQRRRSGDDSHEDDLSPPRKNRRVSAEDRQRDEHSTQRGGDIKEPLDAGKRKGGLLTGSQIREEINMKKAEELVRFELLDPSKSGKGAAPVYRHQGKKVTKEEKLKLLKGEDKPKEKNLEWGKGLAQKREAETKALEIELEKERPFARTRDDPELDKMLKDRIRWGDPMAHLVKRRDSNFDLKDFGGNEKMKESGFIVPQTIPNHSWIKRGLDPPPNRYDIKPGRHWDGVDRSTGYEKELFKRQNEKRATQTEAYLWSVADM